MYDFNFNYINIYGMTSQDDSLDDCQRAVVWKIIYVISRSRNAEGALKRQ